MMAKMDPDAGVMALVAALPTDTLMKIGRFCSEEEDVCTDGWEDFLADYCGEDGMGTFIEDPNCSRMISFFEELEASFESEL